MPERIEHITKAHHFQICENAINEYTRDIWRHCVQNIPFPHFWRQCFQNIPFPDCFSSKNKSLWYTISRLKTMSSSDTISIFLKTMTSRYAISKFFFWNTVFTVYHIQTRARREWTTGWFIDHLGRTVDSINCRMCIYFLEETFNLNTPCLHPARRFRK